MNRFEMQRAIFVWYILIYKTQHKGGVTFQISFSQHRLQMTLGDTNFRPSIWKYNTSSWYKSWYVNFCMIAVQKIEGKLIWRYSDPQKIFANMQTKRKYIIKFFALMHVIKYFAKGYTNNSVYEASQ